MSMKDVARGMSGLPKRFLPFPSIFTFEAPSTLSDHFYEHLQELFDSKEIEWRFDRTTSTACGWARGNVWSRAARRNPGTVVDKVNDRVKTVDKAVAEEDRDEETAEPRESRFIFRIQVSTGKPRSRAMEVQVRWLAGLDTVVFESFCGFVKSKLTELELDANPN